MINEVREVNGIGVTKNLVGINYTKGMFIKPRYIVVHNVSDPKFKTMREYRNFIAHEKEAKVSFHYMVGARAVVKMLEDDWRGWHVGDKATKDITNSNSIAVTMFVRDNNDIGRVIKNTVALINMLRDIYDIPVKNVKRHYDVTGKACPEMLLDKEAWDRFVLALKGVQEDLIPIAKGQIIGVFSKLKLKKDPKDDSEILGEINSSEEFYIYKERGNWVKTSIETENKVLIGYLSKDYVNIMPIEEDRNYEHLGNKYEENFYEEEIVDKKEETLEEDILNVDMLDEYILDENMNILEEYVSDEDVSISDEDISVLDKSISNKSMGILDESISHEAIFDEDISIVDKSISNKNRAKLVEPISYEKIGILNEFTSFEDLDGGNDFALYDDVDGLNESISYEGIEEEEVFEEDIEDEDDDLLDGDAFNEEILKEYILKQEMIKSGIIKEDIKKEYPKRDRYKESIIKKEPLKKEVLKKEPLKKEPPKRESFKQEPLKRESFKQEPIKKESVKREVFKERADENVKIRAKDIVVEKRNTTTNYPKQKNINPNETLPTIIRSIQRDGIIVNVETNLNVRRGPGEENYVVGYLLAGQKIYVDQEAGEWYKIVYQSTIGKRSGYVEREFVKLT